jgi:signal transduction histidine kinase
MRGPVGEVLGVFEIDQDLTGDYAEITKFQYLSVAISLGFAGLIFLVLRQIIVRGERIIEQRNQEQRQLEEKLHHHQRLAALGQMIAAVAHEVRNPLGIISSTAEILQNKIKSYEPHNRLAEVIVQEAQRLNGIVTEFLDFARPQVPEPSVCDLEGVLEKNLAFLNPLFEKENIEIVKDYEFHHNIRADADLLYRAFLNVFMNAVQAMDGGGRLRVATRSVRDQGRDWAEVVVEDSGQGLDPEQAKTVFSPFFTTKNRGTGLGLAIVKNIIDGHQGEVDLSALPEGGARFTARLPVS